MAKRKTIADYKKEVASLNTTVGKLEAIMEGNIEKISGLVISNDNLISKNSENILKLQKIRSVLNTPIGMFNKRTIINQIKELI